MPGPFFIVSTGRSGTTTIARALSVVHNAVSLHEPAPALILESSDYRYGAIRPERIRELLRESRAPVIERSIYIESNQTLSLIIPEILEAFPTARFVWLIRNGLDVVASCMQKQWYTGHSEKHARYEDCPPLPKMWIDGRIQGDRCHDLPPNEWARLDPFGKCCWYWNYVNRVIDHDLSRLARDRFMIIHLEELDDRFRELVRWMGVNAALLPMAPRANPAKRPPYEWPAWTGAERTTFVRFCGELMDRFYPGWRAPGGEFRGVGYRRKWRRKLQTRYSARLARFVNAWLSKNRLD